MPERVAPSSVPELADAVGKGTGTLAVRGGGSKAGWGRPAPAPDLLVETGGLDRVVDHAVADHVVTVQAGVRLADLQERLAAHRQWLALDPPEAGATVGGVLATGAAGPRRLRHGTGRDHLLGVTLVLADGRVVRSGGRVVKNVAGYDLGRLVAGSFGTLAVLAECTLRLHPLPPARRWVVVATADPVALADRLLHSALEPAALEWDGTRLVALFEGRPAAVAAQAAGAVRLAGAGERTADPPAGFGARPWRPGEVALKLTHRIGALGRVLDLLGRELPSGARLLAHAGSGVVEVGCAGDVAEVVAGVTALRRGAAEVDGTVVVVDAPEPVKAALDVWGPVRGLELMRRVKASFDPGGRLAPGTFVGGL